jgi:hypothetical protein
MTEIQTAAQTWQKLIEYIENTKDFVLEQAPDVIQQVLKYEKTSSYLTATLMLLLLCAALITGYYFWRHPALDKYGSREFGSIFGLLVPCIATPMLFIQLCCSVDRLVKIYVAPKYFLIGLIQEINSLQ